MEKKTRITKFDELKGLRGVGDLFEITDTISGISSIYYNKPCVEENKLGITSTVTGIVVCKLHRKETPTNIENLCRTYGIHISFEPYIQISLLEAINLVDEKGDGLTFIRKHGKNYVQDTYAKDLNTWLKEYGYILEGGGGK